MWHRAVATICTRKTTIHVDPDHIQGFEKFGAFLRMKQTSCSIKGRAFTLTSPAFGGSTITVVTSRGFSASQAIAATHSMGCGKERLVMQDIRLRTGIILL